MRKRNAQEGMSMDLEQSEEGLNLTCTSLSNLDLTNPVRMHPAMLPVE